MYYVVSGFLKGVSLLPLPVLYLFSDLVYFIVYYITGYRKEVVMKNLAIAFPEKTVKERIRIAKDFYHNLADTFIETIKFFTWSFKKVEKRFTADISPLRPLYQTGRPIHLLAMHNFNWEYANWWIVNKSEIPFYGIYLPVRNKILDRMMIRMRSKYGTRLIPATEFKNHYSKVRDTSHLLGIAADQSPANPQNAWWVDFFGRKTAFIRGAERGAAASKASVVFVHFYRTSRGRYKLDMNVFTEDASQLPPGTITKAYAAFVESSIRSKPANYLWSHRRWKHEWKPEFADISL